MKHRDLLKNNVKSARLVSTHLRIKLHSAAGLPQPASLPLHLLVLQQGSLLVSLVVEQHGKVQVDQGVGPEAGPHRTSQRHDVGT